MTDAQPPASNRSRGHVYRSTGAEGPQAEDARPAVAKRRSAPVATDWSEVSAPLPVPPSAARPTHSTRPALTVPGLVVLNVVILTIVALLDVLITGDISLITNLTFLVVCALGALFARRQDLNMAWVIPPLGYFFAIIVSGQFNLPTQKHWIVREGAMIGTTLGYNAWWILGGTAIAAIIVAVRRSRGGRFAY